jgi:hypothetical protein
LKLPDKPFWEQEALTFVGTEKPFAVLGPVFSKGFPSDEGTAG